jgi:hypothetical protein
MIKFFFLFLSGCNLESKPQCYYQKLSALSIHRYLKNKDCLSFVACALPAPHLLSHFLLFFAAATNGTNETSKAGSASH